MKNVLFVVLVIILLAPNLLFPKTMISIAQSVTKINSLQSVSSAIRLLLKVELPIEMIPGTVSASLALIAKNPSQDNDLLLAMTNPTVPNVLANFSPNAVRLAVNQSLALVARVLFRLKADIGIMIALYALLVADPWLVKVLSRTLTTLFVR